MNRLVERYNSRVTFLFIYAREAHPPSPTAMISAEENIEVVTPQKIAQVYAQRQASGRLLAARLDENWHVLIDNYGQRGARPSYMCYLDNPLFVIGTDGKIVKSMEWTDAVELEQFLKTFVGLP